MIQKKQRKILLHGEVVFTDHDPKYILGCYEKRNGVWLYCLKGSILTHHIGYPKRVVVSRYTEEQARYRLGLNARYYRKGDIILKRYTFRKFKRTVGPVTSFLVIDSVDEWLEYYDTWLTGQEFRKNRLKEILRR